MKRPRILNNRPVDPHKDMPERFRHLTDNSVIKAKIDLYMAPNFGGRQCFTAGKYYITNLKITDISQMLDSNTYQVTNDDECNRHGLSDWYDNFELVLP